MTKPHVIEQGQEFHYWAAIRELPKNSSGKRIWLCRCQCGQEKPVILKNLTTGRSKGCGCSLSQGTHGKTGTRTYTAWKSMHSRCQHHPHYISNQITVCDRWQSFENFYADMGECPDDLTLDRKDGTKGYEPDNCRWADYFVQTNNTTRNRFVTYQGETKTAAQWARDGRCKVSYMVLLRRLKEGWTVADAIEKENEIRTAKIFYNNKEQSLNAWAKELNMHQGTLWNRLYVHNWSVDQAFTT